MTRWPRHDAVLRVPRAGSRGALHTTAHAFVSALHRASSHLRLCGERAIEKLGDQRGDARIEGWRVGRIILNEDHIVGDIREELDAVAGLLHQKRGDFLGIILGKIGVKGAEDGERSRAVWASEIA